MKIILDLDTGIDDALALSYALGDPMAEVIGVTCTYGNVFREQALELSLIHISRCVSGSIRI